MSHTPTPWSNHSNFPEYIVPLSNRDAMIGASSNGERDKDYAKVIARLDWETIENEDFKHRIWREEGKANAAFIVTACNAHEALVNILKSVIDKPQAMQEIMRKHDLKIDDLDNPMQKLAFTFYTELCESASQARNVLEVIEDDVKGPS